SGNPAAHIGKEPVYRSNGAELRELMGSAAYDELVVRCDAHMVAVQAARSAGSRKLLPLLVHPATLAAQSASAAKETPVIPSPNIWANPDVYEVENRGVDPDGLIEAAMAGIHDWAGQRVLDVGCGSGFHLPRFAQTATSVVGVEPHEPLATLARQRVRDLSLANASVLDGAAQRLPLG